MCSPPAPCPTTVPLLMELGRCVTAWGLCHLQEGPLSVAGAASVALLQCWWLFCAGPGGGWGPCGGCSVQLELGFLQEQKPPGLILSSPFPAEHRMEMCWGLLMWGWRRRSTSLLQELSPVSALLCVCCTSVLPSTASWEMEMWTQPHKNGANPPKAAPSGCVAQIQHLPLSSYLSPASF